MIVKKMLFFCFTLSFAVAKGQTTYTSPAHLVVKLHEITSAVSLTNKQEKVLLNYLVAQDSLANMALKNGAALSDVAGYYIFSPKKLRNVLPATACATYATTLKNNTPEINIIFKNKDLLALADQQIDSLLTLVDINNEQVQKKTTKFLTKPQNLALLVIKQRITAEQKTEEDWVKLKKYNLVLSEDSNQIRKEVFNFEFKQLQELEKVAHLDREQTRRVIFVAKLYKPTILIKLDALTGNMPSSVFSGLLSLNKELSISNNQLDTFASKILKSDSLRYFHNVAPKLVSQYEYETIASLLTPKQLDKYFELRNYAGAEINANKDWDRLLSKNLVHKTDTAYYKEVVNYHVKLAAITEKASVYKIQENVFALNFLKRNPPLLLQKLNESPILENRNNDKF